MKRRSVFSLMSLSVVLLLLLAACGTDDPVADVGDDGGDTDTDTDTDDGDGDTDDGDDTGDGDEPADDGDPSVPQGDLRVVMGHPDTLSTYDITASITHERLAEQGWDVEQVHFARSDLNAQALIQNRVQVIIHQYADPLRAISAAGDDAKVAYVMENNDSEFINIARAPIETCEDIDGMRYGIHGETATVAAASVHWLRTDCGIEPEVVVIPGGDNRIVAMEAGELDATNVQLGDWLVLQQRAEPGEYNIIDSGDLFEFSGAAVWVNTDWAEAEPEVATHYIAELLRTYRMMHDDPTIVEDAIRRHLDMDEEIIPETVAQYLDVVGLAPVDGGTTGGLERAIEFYTEDIEDLEPGLTLDQIIHPWLFDEAVELLEEQGG